jgi:hypothetical protein
MGSINIEDLELCLWKSGMDRAEAVELSDLTKDCLAMCGACDGFDYNCECYKPLEQLPEYKNRVRPYEK